MPASSSTTRTLGPLPCAVGHRSPASVCGAAAARSRASRVVAVDEDEAAVGLDGAVDDRQAQPAAAGLGGEERVEQPVADLGGMPGPSSETRSATPPRSNETPAGASSSAAARPRRAPTGWAGRLHRVEREVEDRAMQQVLVALDAERRRPASCTRSRRPRGDPGWWRRDRRPARHRADVEPLHAGPAHAREVEELGEQPRQAIGLPDDEVVSVRSSAVAFGERPSCSTALRMDASGFLISCASEALSSATASSRSARMCSVSSRFWSEMSWKIAVAVRPVAAGLGRRRHGGVEADRELPRAWSRRVPRRASCAPLRPRARARARARAKPAR